jgi:transcriptional regulator with XRE-family HTH domain
MDIRRDLVFIDGMLCLGFEYVRSDRFYDQRTDRERAKQRLAPTGAMGPDCRVQVGVTTSAKRLLAERQSRSMILALPSGCLVAQVPNHGPGQSCFPRKIPMPMLASTPSPEAGKRLRAERLRVRLSTREVEELSHAIARDKGNQEYSISHAWLTDIENGKFTPSIYKLYSLSLVYGLRYDEVLAFFGLRIGDIGKEQKSLRLPRTHLVGTALEPAESTVTVPLELREKIRLERTNLVSRMFERWGEVPLAFLQQMDLRHALYGYIGMEDYTLDPLVRPGSFVEIDARQKKVGAGNWQSEFDRPIYFVELRDGYVCSWCELDRGHLILVPYPRSRAPIRQVRYPVDADIVGRVTAITMRIAEPRED